ncbi:EscU/YscU/HrcU family type III secretion system export apparatus switch protein [Azospirillum sp.]|uniref:EscU/YscU/HrcU family type III secretion system export apparatus switch protein n=1 Tax=Azospirillum sp. TaxID=34012 RepID=UPI003D72401B
MSDPSSNARAKPQRPVAVALSYELGQPGLPKVVATGRGAVAEQILEVAFANGVKVREDADLVEILSALDLDSEIPVEAIVAVAEILSHVYRANGKLPPKAAPETDAPEAPP